jgi:hypothetical protein
MFFFWMALSMAMPLMFMALMIGLGLLFVRNAEIDHKTLERVRRRNPVSPFERYEPAPMLDSNGRRSWESAVEAEAQRIRRRSIGGFH